MANEKNIGIPIYPLILHRSIYFPTVAILVLEIIFDGIYAAIRIPEFFFNIPPTLKQSMIPIYFIVYFILSTIKLILIMRIVLEWATCSYQIYEDEIKFCYGIFSKNEKLFSTAHMHEVIKTQTFIGRLFNFGSLEIHSPAIKETIILSNIPEPGKYEELLDSRLSKCQVTFFCTKSLNQTV